jgi:hypothetical protein
MNSTRASRPIPLALTMLVAFFAALTALAVSNGHDAHAHGKAAGHAETPVVLSQAASALRSDMRVLWEDHIVWTRLAIISLTTGSPDTQATLARLLKNQADIGEAVKPFYGKAAGNALTAELRKHILIAADVVAAAKAGDQVKLGEAQARWQENANDIASLLSSVNPRFWRLGVLKAEMSRHLTLTTQEVVARLQGNWSGDVATYERIHHHILHMSDLLADGLVQQFRSGSASRRCSRCPPISETRGCWSWSPGGATS